MHAQEDRDADWLLALLLLTAQLIVSVVAIFLVWFQSMSSAGCDNECDYQLFYWSAVAFVGFTALTFVTTSLSVLIGRRRRRIWIAPVVGLGLTLVAALIAYRLGSIGLGV
ncbi:UNVERIFIED_CONTAM: hypothetical protein OHV15_09965 [Microbacterium sp. SLM126]